MNNSNEHDAFLFVVTADLGMQAMITAALHLEGFHRVLTFAHATEVIQATRAIVPTLYILDHETPGKADLACSSHLQPARQWIPCIVFNAPLVCSSAEKPPFLWTLEAPFTLDAFFACVQEALHATVSPVLLLKQPQLPTTSSP